MAIFSSDDSVPGLLGVSGSTLRIISFDKPLNGNETTSRPISLQPYLSVSLPATPRRLTLIDNSIFPSSSIPNPLALVICSEPLRSNTDEISLGNEEANINLLVNGSMNEIVSKGGSMIEIGAKNGPVNDIVPKKEAAYHPWCSSINIYDIVTGALKNSIRLASNEAAFCGTFIRFHGHPQLFFILGTGVNVSQVPLSFESAWIYVYEWRLDQNNSDAGSDNNNNNEIHFELVHKVGFFQFKL